MGDMRRLSNIKWIATGVDGHTHHTCREWMYTSDAPPVEADEYERMKQRAEAAEAKLTAVPVDALINMLNPGGAVDEDADRIEMWIRQLKNSRV